MGFGVRLGPVSLSSRGRMGVHAGPFSLYGGGRRRSSNGGGELLAVVIVVGGLMYVAQQAVKYWYISIPVLLLLAWAGYALYCY